MTPASQSGGDPEQRRRAPRFDDRAHHIVAGRGFEPARRIEHQRQQIQIADRVEEEPRSGQDPMDGLFDIGRILERGWYQVLRFGSVVAQGPRATDLIVCTATSRSSQSAHTASKSSR